jgi:hypothetical protein
VGRVLIGAGVCAVLGIAFSVVATWRSVETRQADPVAAAEAFEAARAAFDTQEPIVSVRDGAFEKRPAPPRSETTPSSLFVLVYHRPTTRLIRAEVAFWFLRMKGPAAQRALSGTGIDLEALGLTVDDLERYGPSLVFEGQRGENRVMLWTR